MWNWLDVTSQFEETEAAGALAPERDRCAQGIVEFMAACGVRMTTTPPQLLELLTEYGLRAIGIGARLAAKGTAASEDAAAPAAAFERDLDGERSGVLDAPRDLARDGAAAPVEDGDREPTRRVVRPATRNG